MADTKYTRKKTGSTDNLTDAQETNRLLKAILKKLNGSLLVDFEMSTGIRTQTIAISASQPQRIAPENKNRKKLTLKNSTGSAIAIYLSDHAQMNSGAQIGTDAYVLNQTEEVTFEFHTNEMWALAASGTGILTVAEE